MTPNGNKFLNAERLFSNAGPQTGVGRFLLFPLTRILIVILFLVPTLVLHILSENYILAIIPEEMKAAAVNIEIVIGLTLFIFLYRLYTNLIEKRPSLELSPKSLLRDILAGLALGAGLIVLCVGTLAIFGYYRIENLNPDWTIVSKNMLWLLMAAFIEELIFRLIVFKLMEEFIGSWPALVISILLFGFAHAGNPNATLWTSIAIAIEAGILLTAAFILTRNIWFPLALHFSWNYFQSTIFGITTSGVKADSLFIPVIEGPEWLTGGEFGIEASVLAVLLCLSAGLILLKKSADYNQIILPRWIRKRQSFEPVPPAVV